jgi:hypothetical protein
MNPDDALLRASMERAIEQKHPRICPVCLRVVDAATNVVGASKPTDGDWSLCAYCGTILRFTNTLGLRCATNDELEELKEISPRTHRLIMLACHVLTKKARRAS